jgi:hypothetical protein
MNLSNKVHKRFGKIDLKDYIKSIIRWKSNTDIPVFRNYSLLLWSKSNKPKI